MPTIIVFDPASGSTNLGDAIILDAIEQELKKISNDAFIARVSLHQKPTEKQIRTCNAADLVIIAGSNMLRGKFSLLSRRNHWQLTLLNAFRLKNLILFGPGWSHPSHKIGYTGRFIYKRILSKTENHSVRDQFTKHQMNLLGFSNVLNTSCPTMWQLTPDRIRDVPQQKAKNVVTTVTDYRKSPKQDQLLINTLLNNYDNVYIWPQGMGDAGYLRELDTTGTKIIPPSLKQYDKLLTSNIDLDYVGTRLHGGIRALQKARRCLIISVDQRAEEIGSDTGLPIFGRENIDQLSVNINRNITSNLDLPWREIQAFRDQIKDLLT